MSEKHDQKIKSSFNCELDNEGSARKRETQSGNSCQTLPWSSADVLILMKVYGRAKNICIPSLSHLIIEIN